MKKITNKKLIATLAVTSAVVALSGCSTDIAKEKESQPKFTSEEETAYVQEFADKVLKPEPPSVILAEVEKNIDRVSEDEASNMVDGLLYAIHQQNPEMNTKIQGLQTELAELDKNNIDFNDAKSLEKIEDETVKAFLEEVQKKKFIIQKVGVDYLARPDVKFVIDTYGEYMKDVLRAMAEFSLDENQRPFYNKEANAFDMNIVVERILKVEENIKEFTDSVYQPAMENSKNYYYQIYFGTNNSFLVDEDKKVLPAIIDHYKDTVKNYPDSQIGKDTKEVLTKLEATDNKVTDDIYVYLLGLTGTETQNAKVDAGSEQEANEELNKVIQEAIKDNKTKE